MLEIRRLAKAAIAAMINIKMLTATGICRQPLGVWSVCGYSFIYIAKLCKIPDNAHYVINKNSIYSKKQCIISIFRERGSGRGIEVSLALFLDKGYRSRMIKAAFLTDASVRFHIGIMYASQKVGIMHTTTEPRLKIANFFPLRSKK